MSEFPAAGQKDGATSTEVSPSVEKNERLGDVSLVDQHVSKNTPATSTEVSPSVEKNERLGDVSLVDQRVSKNTPDTDVSKNKKHPPDDAEAASEVIAEDVVTETEVATTAFNVSSLLKNIEERLAACEQFIGNTAPLQQGIRSTITEKKKAVPDGQGLVKDSYDEALSAEEEQCRAWRGKLESVVSARTSLGSQISRLQQLTEQMFNGKPSELNRKLAAVQTWIDAEGAAVSHILLSFGAKKTYLLQNEARIRDTALLLQQVERYKPYINGSSFSALLEAKDRITTIEQNGHELSRRAARLQQQLEDLCFQYCLSMQMMSSLLITVLDSKRQEPKH